MKKQKKTHKQTGGIKLLSTKAGTATSFPESATASQIIKPLPNEHCNIPNTLWYMKKNGYANTTIKGTGKRLRHLQKNCNLQNPEKVKGYIANKQCTNGYTCIHKF